MRVLQNVDYSKEIDISLEIEVICPITCIEPKVVSILMNFLNNIGQLTPISMENSSKIQTLSQL